ncbi:polysaccharide ABC transporter ATP-binding protein [Desulfovibrio desulfuricans]|uniref:ABC transporter ATP-binding protein n=1 Tax=Desulfovibrio desulfuricans TaxID=876 RepID=UPI0039842CAE
MKPVIQVEGLNKKYLLRHQTEGSHHKTLREAITNLPKRLIAGASENSQEEFWAIKDIDFNIMPGDRVGIVGRNGAGKSTLLKLLSRITEPTNGKITLRGSVASLLEVGTGFHPELTGRENIFLNGAILGMKRREVQSKFDEIVDFSGVEKFLDTPVKRYSSGMYVRLAFAVAAHLEPDILVVDEVLAVGDAEFQKKCLGKMEQVSQGRGRTVLFVSHNMAAVRQLCTRGLYLADGSLKLDADIEQAINSYAEDIFEHSTFDPLKLPGIDITITDVEITGGGIVDSLHPFQPSYVKIFVTAEKEYKDLELAITISHPDVQGIVFASSSIFSEKGKQGIPKGSSVFICKFARLGFCSGSYFLGLEVNVKDVKSLYRNLFCKGFSVIDVHAPETNRANLPAYGHFYPTHTWDVMPTSKQNN